MRQSARAFWIQANYCEVCAELPVAGVDIAGFENPPPENELIVPTPLVPM